MFSFRDIRPLSGLWTLLHTRKESIGEQSRVERRWIVALTVADIDQLLSTEFREELRIVRQMLTGSKPGMQTDASEVIVHESSD